MDNPILQVRDLCKVYGSSGNQVIALDHVSLTVNRGEFVSIVGPSGSGKSTLLHILGGVDKPTSGSVQVDGVELSTLNESRLAVFRRRQIGLIYQFYNLIPVLTVRENLTLPLLLDHRKAGKGQVQAMAEELGLSDRLKALPGELSGGQQQRVSIGRALLTRPALVLDVATGTGDFAIQACRMLPSASLTGVDLSEGMMQVGRRKVEQAGLAARIDFQREDCEALTFADASFDAVTVAFGIRNFEHLDRGLREMCRVLRPGGHLVILELSTPTRFPMKQLFALYSKAAMPLMGRTISHDDSAYTYLPESIRAFPQGEVMQESIRRAGFSQVSFRRLTFGLCTLYMATK